MTQTRMLFYSSVENVMEERWKGNTEYIYKNKYNTLTLMCCWSLTILTDEQNDDYSVTFGIWLY